MPKLIWDSKKEPQPDPTKIIPDTIFYPQGAGYPDASPENRLIYGDNLQIMWSLLDQFAGQINLIYADPPFYTNKRYPTRVGRGEDSRKPQNWKLAEGYVDHWPDLDSYLDFLYQRLVLMHRLLAPDGTLYLHLDWHANSYARVILDEIFGADRLLNEIVWTYHGPSPIRSAFNRKHDTILSYTKSKEYTFNVDEVREPYHPNTVKTFKSSEKAGFGKVPNLKRGKVPEDWWYFPVVARLHNERTGYPTQKPEALMERIIRASSSPGELVADFFSGSGTTAAVAARLGRRFLVSDVTWRAIHTTRSRLVGIPEAVTRIEKGIRAPVPGGVQDLGEKLSFDKSAHSISIIDLSDLDYWSVDPDWDGKVFRSAVQAVRPLKKGKIPSTLKLPVWGEQICVRLVKISGEQIYHLIHNA